MSLLTLKEQVLLEVDEIEFIIKDGDKWAGFVNKLSNLLLKKYDLEEKEAIKNAIRFIVSEGDVLELQDIKEIISELEENLSGERLYQIFKRDIEAFTLNTYVKGYESTNLGLNFEFNKVDKEAIYWLGRTDIGQYWIGDGYSKQLNKKLEKLTEKMLQQGLGRVNAGQFLSDYFNEEYPRTKNYWELMSEHLITRSREFGRLSSYEKAGIQFIKINAIKDSRTSEICWNLHGRILPVSKLTAQRDKLMSSGSVDEVKKIAPWYNIKQVLALIKDVPSNKLPEGIGLPPYHGFCRTTTVIANENEINNDISEIDVSDFSASAEIINEKLQSKIYNREQPSTKEVVKILDIAKHSHWGDFKIKGSNKFSLQHHYEKHKTDKYIKAESVDDYSQKFVNLIKDPKREIYLVNDEQNGVQLFVYDGANMGIVSLSKSLLVTFHGMKRKSFEKRLSSFIFMRVKSKGISKWIGRE